MSDDFLLHDEIKMIEIIASVYVTCLVLSGAIIFWHLSHLRRQLNSSGFQTLNQNLAKLGLFWSHSAGSLEKLSVLSIEEDRQKTLKSAMLLGLLGFASLPGFLLLLAVVLSLRYSSSSRKENKLLQGPLALEPNLAPEDIEPLIRQ